MSTQFDVIIPAGGTIDEAYRTAAGVEIRALAPVGPERAPVLQIVVNSLRESGIVRRIICIAPHEVSGAVQGVDSWLIAGDDGATNILRGIGNLPPFDPILICMSDVPFLKPESIADFAARSRASADLTVGLVRAPYFKAAFPKAPRSQFLDLRDVGPVAPAGLIRVRPAFLIRQEIRLKHFFAARKSQMHMTRIMGARLLFMWATRRLHLAALLERGFLLTGTHVDVIFDCGPDLAYDIDLLHDYAYADTHLREAALGQNTIAT